MTVNFVDSDSIGGLGVRPRIQLMCREQQRSPQEIHNHAVETFENLYAQSRELDGVQISTYRHDESLGFNTSLDHLDLIISGHGTDGTDRIKVWDIGEENNFDQGCNENIVNVHDPAITSSDIYPAVTGFDGNDGLGHNNMHVRVRVATATMGRLSKAALMSLCRIHDHGEWDDSASNLPKSNLTNVYNDIGSALETDSGGMFSDPTWEPKALGHFTDPMYSINNGPCQRVEPDDYQTGAEYLPRVTSCTAGHVDDAINYFQ